MRTLPNKFLAAVIAVPALPGSPRYNGDIQSIIDQSIDDVRNYSEVGVDCILLENSHDLPYIKPPLPVEAVEGMTRVAQEVRQKFDGAIGIQVLEAANETALEIAAASDLDFVRVESYVFAHVGGAGIIQGCAGVLQRKKKELGCEHIKFFADVKKKHCSHALTADLDIVDEVKQAEFFFADGIIVTGPRTAEPPDTDEISLVKSETKLPVLIGSGMTPANISTFFQIGDGFIVGSTFRNEGKFLERLDRKRLDNFMDLFLSLRSKYGEIS